jgi:DNA-binding MarR family transcriptional regulator
MNISISNDRALIDEILDQLEPLVARQRRAIARDGCLRNISSTQLHVLFLLISGGELTMTGLADRLGVSLPNVTGIVERMVERGLVERTRSDDDRRIVAVRATDEGRRTVEEIELIRRSQMAALLECLSTPDQERALRTFRSLRRAAEALDAMETTD